MLCKARHADRHLRRVRQREGQDPLRHERVEAQGDARLHGISHSFKAKICFLSTVISSSYLRRFSNNTLSDFGSLDIPSKPFFSAIFRLKILYSFPEDEIVSSDLKEFLLLNFMRYT